MDSIVSNEEDEEDDAEDEDDAEEDDDADCCATLLILISIPFVFVFEAPGFCTIPAQNSTRCLNFVVLRNKANRSINFKPSQARTQLH